MNNPSLLSLLLVLLLAVPLPPAAAVAVRVFDVVGSPSSYIQCVDGIVYAANSTFDANRHRLAGLLQAEAAAGDGPDYTERAVGYWPFRAQASFWCTRRGVDGAGFCAACLAGAFLELERECPYGRTTRRPPFTTVATAVSNLARTVSWGFLSSTEKKAY